MKHLNPFFVTGSLGMILTALLHAVFALILDLPLVHPTFWVLYPSFFAFMTIGVVQILKAQLKPLKKRMNT